MSFGEFIAKVFTRISKVWTDYSFQNCWTIFLFIMFVAMIARFVRSERGRYVIRYFKKRKLACLSTFVFALFILVGFLDSISWRDASIEKVASGKDTQGQPIYKEQEMKDNAGNIVLESEGRSLLVRLCNSVGIGDTSETTYSAPFAEGAFIKVMKPQEDGTIKWVDQPLKHKGKYIMGTDAVGDDVLMIALRGIRTALIVGGFTTLISIPIAIVLGVLAGYFGGWIDVVIQYIYSTVGSIPYILVIAAFMIISRVLMGGEEPGIFVLCLGLGLTSWTGLCRLLRGETLKARELEYVQSARALGSSSLRLIFKHIMPNIFHLVIITAVLNFSGYVLAEVVLSYLGIGVGSVVPSWGMMVSKGSSEFARDPIIWWNMLATFLLMMGLVLPANLFGDTLRDALDPKLRGQS